MQGNPGSARYYLFIPCVLFVFLLIHCGTGTALTSGKNTSGENTVILKKKDNAKEITVQCGALIQIELEETGSAGYRWHAENQDTEYVVLLDEKTKTLEEGKMGAPILSIWRFKAVKEGITEIKMGYYRDWEGPEKTADRFAIKLTVQK